MAKRQWRNDMSQQQKDKLSAINKGKRHSQQTKDKIAKSMEDYWRKLPYKPATSTSGGTTPGTPGANF